MNFFKKYTDYLKDNPKKYWFKCKLFGWGWTPATWQGWLLTLVYLFIIIGLSLSVDENSSDKEVYLVVLLPVFILTIAFIRLAHKKGEPLRWQWGLKKK